MAMHHRLPLLLLVTMAVLCAPPLATPQSAPFEILADAAGDQAVTSGTLVTTPPAYGNVDILSVTADDDGDALTLTVTFGAAPSATQNVTLNLTVSGGPASLPESTAAGASHELRYRAGAVTGITGATVAASDTALVFAVPLSSLGAVGGDVIEAVTVAAEDFNGGTAPAPVTQDDTRASDQAPDSGSSTPYTLTRPPVSGAIALAAAGGSSQDGTAAAVAFTGNETHVSANATSVQFRIAVTNIGLDPDTVILSVAETAPGTSVSLQPSSLPLAAGATAEATFRIALEPGANGTLAFRVAAVSDNGGHGELRFLVHVEALPAAEREPVPAALGFLTPLATSLGLDQVFGPYAELAFLLFALLLLVVGGYLLLFLVRTPWVRIRVTPRKAIVAPGGVAEFQVEMAGRRKSPTLARATLRTEGGWTSGLQVGHSAARPGESVDVPLESGKEAAPQEAVLRVQVPYDAGAKDRQELELDIVPVDSEGAPHPKHASRAKVVVEAAAPAVGKYASAHDIRLAEVRHDPPDPRPGATVRTTSSIHNEGPALARLRVVLQKDGKTVAEETVDVPPHDSRQVPLTWTAGSGRNLVKVQIFLA